jgi:O-antigen/teichoic acid export membrane protein
MENSNKSPKKIGISKKLYSDVGVVFFANLSNNGVAFMINIVIAKFFPHDIFGVFSIAINISTTLQVIAEFGMNITMLKLYKEYEGYSEKRASVLVWNILFKLLQISIILNVYYLLNDMLSLYIMKKYDYKDIVICAIASGLMLLLWEFFKTIFQLKDKFKLIATCTALYSILRLLLLLFFYNTNFAGGIFSVFLSVYILPLSPILVYCSIYFILECDIKKSSFKTILEVDKEYRGYSKWVALSGITFILMQSSMIFMVSTYCDLKSVSLLSAGLVFTAVFSLFNASITQVLLPKAANISLDKIPEYKRKLVNILPFILIGGVLVVAFFTSIMYFVLGNEYKDSIPIFWISSLGSLFVTWLGMYSMVLHSIKRPDINGLIGLISLILFVSGGYLILNYTENNLINLVCYYSFAIVSAELTKRHFITKVISKIAT